MLYGSMAPDHEELVVRSLNSFLYTILRFRTKDFLRDKRDRTRKAYFGRIYGRERVFIKKDFARKRIHWRKIMGSIVFPEGYVCRTE